MSNRLEIIKQRLSNKTNNWLVTGAAGFIGSHLVQFLLENKQKVIAIDNFSTGLKSNIDFLEQHHNHINNGSQFTFFELDIRNSEDCHTMTQDIDYVLHQAAIGSVPRSIEDPFTTHDSNVNGFLNIIYAAKENKVKNFVYASSSSVYGDSEVLPKKESHQGQPLSPYAVTKNVNETYAMAFFKAYGFNSIGLRYFNVFGLRQDPEGQYAAVIPKWINSILAQEDLYINGDGSTTRDFCYVDNAVQANILAAITDKEEALNRVYNIAADHQITLLELYNTIKTNISTQMPTLELKKPIYRDFRPGDIMHSRADIRMAEELLGYEVTMSVSEGLEDLVRMECSKA